MIRVLVIGLFLYFLYKFVFHFIIPVVKTTSAMKQKMNEFQNNRQEGGFPSNQEPVKKPIKEKMGDYIDFEEVK